MRAAPLLSPSQPRDQQRATPQGVAPTALPESAAGVHRPLSEVEERLLRSIYDLQYLTVEQLAKLHYQSTLRSTLNYVAALMKGLETKHYVQRGYLARAVAFARNPSVFRLASKGSRHMKELGLTPLPKFRPTDPFPSFEKLKHTLCINEVIVAVRTFLTNHPDYQLAGLLHDWILHHMPVYLPNQKRGEAKVAVIADAWLDIVLPPAPGTTKEAHLPIHLELDRGTEDWALSFKPKFAARVAYTNGPYEQHFHTPFVTIAYATTRGKRRVERLLTWAEEELTRLHQEEAASLFYFTALPTLPDPQTGKPTEDLSLDPDNLLLAPVWYTPFDHTPKPLLAYD